MKLSCSNPPMKRFSIFLQRNDTIPLYGHTTKLYKFPPC
jgi:hypothetical protein